jgi:hypothetical protein
MRWLALIGDPSGYNLTLASDFGFRRRLARANLGDAQSHQD